jgi:hypothetical protein
MSDNQGYKQRKGIETWQRLQKLPWLNCTNTSGAMTAEQVYDEYLKTEAVVSTALVEGGPMACYEAIAMDKPYYGRAGVGVHDETKGVILYTDDDNLERLLKEAYDNKAARIAAVEDRTWKRWAAAWWDVINSVSGGAVQTAPVPARKVKPKPSNSVTVFSKIPKRLSADMVKYLEGKGYKVTFTPKIEEADIDLSSDPNMSYFQAVRSVMKQLGIAHDTAAV